MILASLNITTNDFDSLCGHILTHKPKYSNMALRDTKTVKGERAMRHLHIMKATSDRLINGTVGGEIFIDYQIRKLPSGRIQINVASEIGDSKLIQRFRDRFLKDIFVRMAMEQSEEEHNPRRKKGQYYVRRWAVGTAVDHPTAQQALKSSALQRGFLEKLSGWNFELIVGRK